MGDIMEFPGKEASAMDREELENRLALLRQAIAQLDSREPENMEDPDYEDWAEEHEDLEDQLDEVLDCLDELE